MSDRISCKIISQWKRATCVFRLASGCAGSMMCVLFSQLFRMSVSHLSLQAGLHHCQRRRLLWCSNILRYFLYLERLQALPFFL